MTALTYRLTLDQPALLAAPGGDPNSATSLPYIPGGALRGAVAGRYARDHGGFDAADPEPRRLFFDGATRFLHAFLVVRSSPHDVGVRGLPAPRSLRHRKGDPDTWYDFAAYAPGPDDADPYPAVGADAVLLDADEGLAAGASPERHVAIHTARDRAYGRAREGSGAVYRYDALAPGQTFAGAVLCDDPADAARLADALEGPLFVGGARSAGYGRARLHDLEVVPHWREASAWPGAGGPDDALTVTLLSETILRDPATGQPSPSADALAAAVADALGVPPAAPRAAFLGTALVGGFNRAWDLPLPQTPALDAGTVLVLPRPSSLDPERARRLEHRGLGDRRAEGYGRLALDLHGAVECYDAPQPRPLAADARDRDRLPLPAGTDAHALGTRMARRMLEAQVDRLARARAAEFAGQRALAALSRSQLGRLRAALLRALYLPPEPGRALLSRYLDSVDARGIAREQFQKAPFAGHETLLGWLRATLLADALPPDLLPPTLPEVGPGLAAAVTPDLAYRVSVQFAHEVALRAAKARPAHDD